MDRRPVVFMIPQLQINISWSKYIPIPVNLSELSDMIEIKCNCLEIFNLNK